MIPPYYGTEDHRAYQNKIVENTARAVREAGVTHVIHLSSEGAELAAGTGPILGLRAHEQRLNGLAGVNVLHLRPADFMENLLMNIDLFRKM